MEWNFEGNWFVRRKLWGQLMVQEGHYAYLNVQNDNMVQIEKKRSRIRAVEIKNF